MGALPFPQPHFTIHPCRWSTATTTGPRSFMMSPLSAHLVLGPVISSNHIPLTLPQAASLLHDKGLSWQPGGADGRGIGLSTECGSSVNTLRFHKGHDHGGSWQMRPWPGLFSGAAGLKPDQSIRVPCCSSRGVQGEGRFRGERRGRQQGTRLCLCRQVRVQTHTCGHARGWVWTHNRE